MPKTDNMKYATFISLAILTALTISGCKDFIAKDIANDTVTVLAPTDNTVTTSNAITFWWDALDGAESYNLQVVKPNFAAAQALIADSNVTGNKLLLNLSPGTYQWRIRATNGGGNSKYAVFNLTVDTTSNLSEQLVVPIGPAANAVRGDGAITFSWNAISSAEKYNLYINSSPEIDVTIPGTSYTSTFAPGSYSWKVKAINAFSVSQFNVARGFKIDLTSPGPPNNLSVTGTSSTKVADSLKWKRNAGDVSFDSLFIYEDVSLVSLNTATIANLSKIQIGELLSAPSSSYTPYWWRVKSVDSVGNRSVISATSTFTLTP